MACRILLADDHGIVRQGVRSLLERQGDVEVVAEAGDGVEIMSLVQKFRPDVVIFDVTMSNFNGIEATREILEEFPCTKVMALSVHLHIGFVKGILEAGACAYIFKDGLFEELVGALRTVLEGGIYLSPCITGIEVDGCVKYLAEDSKF